MKKNLWGIILSLALVLNVFPLEASAADPVYSHWPYASGFEGTDGGNFVNNAAASNQYGWRAYEYNITPVGQAINAASGSGIFSTSANSQPAGTTGVKLDKSSTGDTIMFEKGINYANTDTPTFDATKDYLLSFKAKKTGNVVTKFHLINNPMFKQVGGWDDNYSIVINTSDIWQYYYIFLGANTKNKDKLADRRSIERFTLEGTSAAGTLYIDEYQVKELNIGNNPESKELVVDGGFENVTFFDGQPVGDFDLYYTGANSANGDVVKYSTASGHAGNFGIEAVHGSGVNMLTLEKKLLLPAFSAGKTYRISFWADTVSGKFEYTTVNDTNWDPTHSFNRGLTLSATPRRYSFLWGPKDATNPINKYLDHTYIYPGYTTGNPIIKFFSTAADTLYLDDLSIEEVSVPDISISVDISALTASNLNTNVIIKNNDTSSAKNNIKVIGVLYDSNKKLVNSVISDDIILYSDAASTGDGVYTDIANPAGQTYVKSVPINFTLNQNISGAGYKLVLYVWDSLNNIRPLSDKKVLAVDNLSILKN